MTDKNIKEFDQFFQNLTYLINPSNKDMIKVFIFGEAADIPDEKTGNLKISKDRADAVKTHLLKNEEKI